ncbi:MAG: LysR substrate-binding domain-containing protein [Betaproteobacteria bacterium]
MYSRHWQLPPLELLLAFEASARHLSFTRAAEELFLTQSAVSRQIQALEASMGGKLFERRTRALLLTERGQRFHRTVQAVLGELDEATQMMRGEVPARTVTVTTMPGFASLWLIPRLNGYVQANPGVDVRISASSEIVNLERAGMDLAVRYGATSEMGDAPLLFGESVIPVCSPALAADPKRPLRRPEDLRHHVLLNLDNAQWAWLDWDIWLNAHGAHEVKPAGTLQFSQYDQLIQAAAGGQGVALGRLPLVRRMLRDKLLVAPFKRSVPSSRGYFLVRSTRTGRNRDVAAFADWLLAETRRDAEG